MPDDDHDRTERPRRGEAATGEDALAAIRAAPAPVVNTRYVANELRIARAEAAELLTELFDEGRVCAHGIGDRVDLWWIPDEFEDLPRDR
ncbi:hypothetical protein [Halegenticoccus soli]|uniref:hypothetical protein n=1 Tax=Halegenticoccus soli TaxID=1985678 RepID=UPI000C6E9602|nr:hypothetical protein [Halegenticoccus soli]